VVRNQETIVTESVPQILDSTQLSPRQLMERLRAVESEASVQIELGGAEGVAPAGLCSGLAEHIQVEIMGSVGDFCYTLGAEAALEIRGRAGDCLGHSMLSGQVTVHGPAGRCVAAYARGGFVAVLGQAGECCGLGLQGADVLVRSRTGDKAGWGMRGGTLVLGNGAGEELGAGMSGGVIYVRGEVKSKSSSVRVERFKDTDALRLSLLLARAGIKASGAEFKVYRAKGTAA